jgi:methyl-accepting chemotaxis protein
MQSRRFSRKFSNLGNIYYTGNQMFKNTKIKTLLTINLTFIIILLLAVGSLGLYGLNKSNASLQTVYADRLVPASDLGDIRVLLMRNRLVLNRALIFRNVEESNAALSQIQKNNTEIDRYWKKYIATYLVPEEEQLVAKMETAYKAYLANAFQPAVEAIKVQNFDELQRIITAELGTLYQPVEESMDGLCELQPKVGEQEYEESQDRYHLIFTIILISAIASLIIAVFGSLNLLKRIIGPISRAAQMVGEIAKGKLDTRINVENNDEIGVLMEAFKPMLTNLNSLISEMNYMAIEHDKGDIDVVIDASKFDGDFEEIAMNINKMVLQHISVKKQALACVKAFGEGDFEAPLEKFPGKKAFINDTIEEVRTNLKNLIEDAYWLAAQAQEGNLAVRADANRHKGDFRKIISGINFTLDAVIVPIQETIEQITKYSRGDMSGTLTAEYKGEFAELKKRLNYLSATMKGVIDSCAYVKNEHDQGNIDIDIAADRFKGDFGVMATNINELVLSHINLQNRVVEIVQQYGKGNFSVDMDRLPGKKGEITTAVDGVKASLVSMQSEITALARSAQAGNLSARAEAGKFEHSFKDMVVGINATLDAVITPLNVAAGYVERIAHGDIPAPITDRYNGDFNTIKTNLNTCIAAINSLIEDTNMLSEAAADGRIQTRADASRHQGDFRKIVEGVNATLETIVTPIITVKSAVDSISTAAREISAGNADLSHRTEQQAASLEETASSMEELASTVKQNADNARQANQMAAAASDVAAKGGGMVQQVVDTMYSINESSRKIVDIISVIDGIALQTNILALNAAVEAARAGEQGRGFAVVASEVRNLAQRSAAAAKEIKALIGDSVEKVEDGSKLVGEAGKTMEEIVNSVKRVTDIMADIAAASAEQSSGIDQVNMAVTQMDEVTQQNAALVEEAAAAAESLEEQAETLAQTVAQFRMESDIRSPVQRRPSSLAVVKPKPAPQMKASVASAPRKQEDDEWVEF